jgi:GNAT superfamily N-acetyltransferase
MKQIGIGLWTGHPQIGAFAEEARQAVERIREREERELAQKSPVQRFFHLARQTWKQPNRYVPGWENDFVGHDFGVMHYRAIAGRADCFPDLPDAANFLVFLKLLYVVDAHQGEGIGRRCLTEMASIAERSGAAVFLYCERPPPP